MDDKPEFKTWLEALEARHFEPTTMELMLGQMSRVHFQGDLPPGFEFLGGTFVDLGFEDLGISKDEQELVQRAIAGTGLAVPGTPFKMQTHRPFFTYILPSDGSETATLPVGWKQAVAVLGNGDQLTWIGKKVRPERVGEIDYRLYQDMGDGWQLARSEERT